MAEQLTLRIDLDSDIPAYRQIVNIIRILLVSQQLLPGADLPSVRRMATDLGVHFNTVAEAYRILADEGWLALRQGKGATVIERKIPEPTPERMEEFRHRVQALAAEMFAHGASPESIGSELWKAWTEFKS